MIDQNLQNLEDKKFFDAEERASIVELCKRPTFYILSIIIAIWSILHFSSPLTAFAATVFGIILVAHSLIDLRYMILPDLITLPATVLGILLAPTILGIGWANSLIGGFGALLLLGGVFFGFYLIRGYFGMGFGDVKLLAMLGFWVGAFNIPIVLLLSSFAAITAFTLRLVIKKKSSKEPMPFGPYLAISAWFSLLYGPIIWLKLLQGQEFISESLLGLF